MNAREMLSNTLAGKEEWGWIRKQWVGRGGEKDSVHRKAA
jgi:hypothetical protein